MNERRLMATGHCRLRHPRAVAAGFARALVDGRFDLAVTGGAAGGDTAAARAARSVAVPFEVMLPNRFYRQRYPDAIPDDLLAAAVRVEYVVDRTCPPGTDPVAAWRAGHWEVDNHRRNAAMGVRATHAAVLSPHHPLELAGQRRGGTAHCVRTLVAQGYTSLLWIHDDPRGTVETVELGPPTLFPPDALSHR